jgi:hypothetical protein
VPVSRQTTTRDIQKYVANSRAKLVTLLSSSTINSISITSDIWSGNAKQDYLLVVDHYINSDWQMEKRVLGLRLIDCSHSGQNIIERVATILAEYGLTEKVFVVTLDNVSSNVKAMQKLRPLLSKYLGIKVCPENPNNSDEIEDLVNSVFLHQRCACHIINLIV